MNKTILAITDKSNRVICGGRCQGYIHVDNFGGIKKVDGKPVLFCKTCIVLKEVSDD